MRLWRCAKGLLIDRGPTATVVIGSILAMTRRAWPERPADYWMVDEHGAVIELFTAQVFSIEDELSARLFAVEDRSLVQIDVRSIWGREVAVAERVVLAGLEPVEDATSRACARTAFEKGAALEAEQIRQGEARVAAIPGANDELGAGADFTATQRALRGRVAGFGDQLSETLLDALVRFGQLFRSAPVVKPALDIFVAACRREAFDRTLPRDTELVHELLGPARLNSSNRAEAAEIVLRLGALESTLDREAESQELVDARNNAAAFAAAARGAARARALLEALLAETPAPGLGLVSTSQQPSHGMVYIPRARVRIGLTPDEADHLASELARMEEALHDPGIKAFDVFDFEAVRVRRREWLETSMPAREVEVGPFEIDVDPVTNARWMKYATKTGAPSPAQSGPDDWFVTGISWQEAEAFARHHGLDLPSEAEWEAAARSDGRLFTWGNEYFPQGNVAFKHPQYQPYPVGSRPELDSRYGVHDLLGQFGEYCRDLFAPYEGANLELWNRHFPQWQGQRVVRGGTDVHQDATCVSRRGVPPNERRAHLKFRCVRHA